MSTEKKLKTYSKSVTQRPEVVAITCPLWHPYDHMNSWHAEGWTEYELLRAARPRFADHRQPLEPEWGYYDESDPAWQSREIDLAADHGVDVFLVDWYWYSGVRIMEETLERGFLRAPNRGRLKFALMWANHPWEDYFPAPFGSEWNSWLPIRHSAADFLRMIGYAIEHYFREPNYWRVDGRLFLSLFAPRRLIDSLGGPSACRAVLDEANRLLHRHDLPSLYLQGMLDAPDQVSALREAGFDATGNYNVVSCPEVRTDGTMDYGDIMRAHRSHWNDMRGQTLPMTPIVTMGWDVTPRCLPEVPWPFPPDPRTGKPGYPYIPIITGNTPQRFGELCEQAMEASRHPDSLNAVFINAWNEWTEASYLLPEKRTGTAYLEALLGAFGGRQSPA